MDSTNGRGSSSLPLAVSRVSRSPSKWREIERLRSRRSSSIRWRSSWLWILTIPTSSPISRTMSMSRCVPLVLIWISLCSIVFVKIGWYVHANWFYWCGKDLIFWCLGQRKFVTFDFKDENLNILRVKLCCYLISGWFIVLTYWSCWFEKRFDFGCLWWVKFRAFSYMHENLCLRVICYCLLVRMRL